MFFSRDGSELDMNSADPGVVDSVTERMVGQ
jgi:hypothetical protein